MMREIVENMANEFRAKVRRDYQSEVITEGHFQEMMIFIDEIVRAYLYFYFSIQIE